jgi:hypothetical protein
MDELLTLAETVELHWPRGPITVFYRKHPWSRKQAANGTVYSLQHLSRFCRNFAEDEETGWYPNIKIPKKVDVPAGRVKKLARTFSAKSFSACFTALSVFAPPFPWLSRSTSRDTGFRMCWCGRPLIPAV